jgi:CO/xanthine dehydrogenase Mo-binding subunit
VNDITPVRNIGTYVPMVDGPEKVSGRAKYTADLILPGMLAARIFRSPYSHAEILDVDVTEAAKLPGVKAIVTGSDCNKAFGVLPVARTEHVLARDRVRYRGEPIAAVAAIDDAVAKEALRRIKLTVRELPAYHTAGEAMAADAIALHQQRPLISSATCCSSSAMSTLRSMQPTLSAKASTIAPRSARTRWRCTRRSPTTTQCVIA